MNKRTLQRRLTTLSMGIIMILTANVGYTAPDIGALDIGSFPEIKIDQAKAELGKRLFFDPRLSASVGWVASYARVGWVEGRNPPFCVVEKGAG